MSAYNVEKIRADFPILGRDIRGQSLIYLDSAASALKPLAVINRLNEYYKNETSNIHRAAHYLGEQGTIAYEKARDNVARFIRATHSSEIIFTRGTTESINLVAQSFGDAFLKAGDEIILSELEHHSNIVPWQMIAEKKGCTIKVIPINDAGELIFEKYLELLSPRTKMVSITWCSNVLGTVVPVEKYAEAAHRVGAKIMVDAAQGVASLVTDVQKMKCDFLAFSGHKVFGPYGIGVLYGKADLLEAMPPYQTGGSMISQVTWGKTTWAAVPHKFEAGTPEISGAVGLDAALTYVSSVGLEAIARHEHELLVHATRELSEIPDLKIYGPLNSSHENKAAILSFTMKGAHPSDVGSLIDQQGIAVRAGHHCCQPLMHRLGIPATVRASFSMYNTKSEVDSLKQSLIKAQEFF
jgi:cysteine desulfurase / selenocysteine lyase